MRVYLTGFMGAGKSTVGGLLAGELDCRYIDLDAEVEAATRLTVRDIFETEGEPRFRQLEDEQLRRTGKTERCVVATGGGTPIELSNRRWMRAHGTIVWLRVGFDSLRQRVNRTSARPLWRDDAQAREVFESRLGIYGDCDLEIEAQAKTPRALALEIADRLASMGLR